MVKLPKLQVLRLKALRGQTAFAELAKVARGTIAHIEEGGDCSLLTAHKIAQALGTTPEALQGIAELVRDLPMEH